MLHVSLFVLGHFLQLIAAKELLNGTTEFGEDYTDYIFGGYQAEKHTPWMAFLGNCGGAVISDQAILTAAHCINWKKRNPKYVVKVGSDFKAYDIVKTFHNTNFDIDASVLTGNDIALFITKEKIRFGPSVQPICLPLKPMWGAKISLSGFGAVTTFIDEYKKLHAAKFNKIKRVSKADWKKYVKLAEKRRKSKTVKDFLKKISFRLIAAIKTLFPGLGNILTLLGRGVVPRKNRERCLKILTKPIGSVPNKIRPEISRQALEKGVNKTAYYINEVAQKNYKNVHQRFVAFMKHMLNTRKTPLSEEGLSPDVLMKMEGVILSPETCLKPKRDQKGGLTRGSMRVPWDGTCLDVSHSSFCSGDSGGPISTRLANGQNYILGLVAYNSQNLQNFPDACNCNCQKAGATDQDVVTRVDMYTKWIKGILKKEGLSPPAC